MTTTQPSRRLLGNKPHRYVNAVSTDIRRTFRRFRLLSYLQRKREQMSAGPGLVLQAA